MKVQWQLIDIETGKKHVTFGDPFDFDIASIEDKWKRRYQGSMDRILIKILNKEK